MALVKISREYVKYINIFSQKADTKLLKYTKINNYLINLKKVNKYYIDVFIAYNR